jgi:hypothetical protein
MGLRIKTMSSMALSDYLDEHEDSRRLLERVRQAIIETGLIEERETKSQVAFRRRRRTFALAWAPRQYVGERGAQLVLTVVLPERDAASRRKEVVEPHAGVFMHHLELRGVDDIDDQVKSWIKRAYDAAR